MRWLVLLFLNIGSLCVGIPVFIAGYENKARAYDLDSDGILRLTDIYPVAPALISWTQHPINQSVLYAVQDFGGGLFSFSSSRGSLTQTSKMQFPEPFVDAPFLLTEPRGRWLYASRGEFINLISLLPNGNLDKILAIYYNGLRTEHMTYDPTGRFLFATSYGNNTAGQWIVADDGTLTFNGLLSFPFGSSPYHLRFGPKTASICYMVAESAARVYTLNNNNGTLSVASSVKSSGITDKTLGVGSEIKISKDEKFLYVGNRAEGESSVTIFSIGTGGVLTRIKDETGGGSIAWPRWFEMDADEKFIVVANRRIQNIVALRRDAQTGLLTKTSVKDLVGADPSFVAFFNLSLSDPIVESSARTVFVGLFALILCLL